MTDVAAPPSAEESGVAPAHASAPPPGLWGAVKASWILVFLVIVICAAAGAAYGLKRAPQYSATARLAVLRLNFGSAGALSGFSTAAEALADAYARGINSDGVVHPLAKEFHKSVSSINDQLTAAAVPQSPIFTITATTASPSGSVKLAAAAAKQLVSYFQLVNSSNPDGPGLYQQLSTAETKLADAREARSALASGVDLHLHATHTVTPSKPAQAALSRIDADVQTLNDRVTALKTAYSQNVVSTSDTQFIQSLASPLTANSDRTSRLGLLVFVGLAVGLGLGTLLALARQAWLSNRRR